MSFLPERFRSSPAPWWIPQEAPAAAPPPAPTPAPAVAAGLPSSQEWAEAEAEAARMERINKEFGTFPQRVLSSEYFVGKER